MKVKHKKAENSSLKKPSLPLMKKFVQQALQEDIGKGDITSEAIIPPEIIFHGKIVAKESGVIAGLEVAGLCFRLVNPMIKFQPQCPDGQRVEKGDILATLKGPAGDILKAERTALNFLQRMSGIATLTASYLAALKGTTAILLDTRKTAPGLRIFDKWAVRLGGGHNHRLGLYDMILIKENHIQVAGSLTEAVNRVRKRYGQKKFIEIEVKNLTELQEALALKVQRIMLDNMRLDDIRQAVRITAGRIPLEVSGNVTLDNIADIAQCGVQYISCGSLTHSVKALDLSLLLTGTK